MKSFSIETKICPTTKQPYGQKYSGTFTVRRPSIHNRNAADIKKAALLNIYGSAAADAIGDWTKTTTHIMCMMNEIATAPMPEWFDLRKMYDEIDEDAIMSVWEEVGVFLDSFRTQTSSETSSTSSDQP